MDRLFKTRKNVKGSFSFDSNTTEVFDDMLKRSVPFYPEIQRMILELSKAHVQKNSNIYDLGCSTGTTLLNLAKNINKKNVKFIGIDASDAMLKKAKMKLSKPHLMKCCELMNIDLNTDFSIKNTSVVIMCLILQFVKPLKRKFLLKRIHAGLTKGGCLILVEKIHLDDSAMNTLFTNLYYEYKLRKKYSKLEIKKKREALDNVLIPYKHTKNMELLKKSGFRVMAEFFRWYNFCGVIAIKK